MDNPGPPNPNRAALLKKIAVTGSGVPTVPKKEPKNSRIRQQMADFFADPGAVAAVERLTIETQRHIDVQRTNWKDLGLMMVPIPGDPAIQGYRCPTVNCSFESSTEEAMRTHCLEDCEDKCAYNRMYDRFRASPEELIRSMVAFGTDPFIGLAELEPVLYPEVRSNWTKVAEMYVSNQKSDPLKAMSTTSDSFDELKREIEFEFETIWQGMVAEYESGL